MYIVYWYLSQVITLYTGLPDNWVNNTARARLELLNFPQTNTLFLFGRDRHTSSNSTLFWYYAYAEEAYFLALCCCLSRPVPDTASLNCYEVMTCIKSKFIAQINRLPCLIAFRLHVKCNLVLLFVVKSTLINKINNNIFLFLFFIVNFKAF